jgi:uncharacterized caspase-like protein
VGDALRQIGFKTTIIADADYNTLQKGLQTYAGQVRAAGENAISFFYYSGHGVANPETGANYLIPVDADVAAPSSLTLLPSNC